MLPSLFQGAELLDCRKRAGQGGAHGSGGSDLVRREWLESARGASRSSTGLAPVRGRGIPPRAIFAAFSLFWAGAAFE